jgi:hypothetical protein
MKMLHVFDNDRRKRRILSSYDMPLGDVPSFYVTEVSAVRTSRNWHKYVTEVSAVNTSRNWHKDSRKRDPTDSVGQAMPSYPDYAVMEQLDCHRVSHMETSLNLSGMQPNNMCSFWGPAKELSQDIDVLVVVGVAVNCEDQITHIVDDHGLYITFECAHEYMTASTRDRPLTARFITEVSLRLIRYKKRVAERVEGNASVYTVAVESSDHGYIASLILFKTTIDNLILRLRNIGSLVPKVIQKISLLMQSYTSSEKWQSLVNPFRGVSREVPMLISDKNWLLSVEPFRGVSCEMTTSGLSSEVRTYAGTCQMDECRIMRPVAMDRAHLTARCTGVSSPCIMYITRSLVLMLHASGRCTVRTYEYYWGKYPVLVVLCTVVLLYLNSAERAHMYLNTCTYPDTCKHERTPVTLNVLGVENDLVILEY